MSTDDQQKRGGLVPIGKVAVRLPGIEGRGRAMSARARQHFTLLKQAITDDGLVAEERVLHPALTMVP